MTSPQPADSVDPAADGGPVPRDPLDSPATASSAARSAPLTMRQAWVLSLAWGYLLLLVLGCAAVLLGWRGLKDTLDVRYLFK